MSSRSLPPLQQLKISCLSRGIRVTPAAEAQLSNGGRTPLTVHEYVTTGGVTLEFEGGIYVNAPFDEWYCDDPEAVLLFAPESQAYSVTFRGDTYPVRVLPLPGYLEERDSHGNLVKETTFSHADRVRISPIYGCAFRCDFCDFVGQKYVHRPAEQLIEGIKVSQHDDLLPVKHILISGGTPSPRDYAYFDEVCERVIRGSDMPVDVMFSPRRDDIVDRMADWGIHGYSMNLEVFDRDVARRITPHKFRLGLETFEQNISRAVARVGSQGRVRSLILVGLEPVEKTLEGVEWLARLGCDPVLSPFRPSPATPLRDLRPPSIADIERVYLDALEIVDRYGVKLGPRCIPCQHNTLSFPDTSGAYYYS